MPMQEQQEFSGGTAGGVGREQPVEPVGLAADLVAMQRDARDIVAGQLSARPAVTTPNPSGSTNSTRPE